MTKYIKLYLRFSPLILIAGIAYLLVALFTIPASAAEFGLLTATFIGILSSQTVLVGAIVVLAIARRSARDLDMIPGVYMYWALQVYAVVAVMIRLAVRRPPPWKVTAKRRATIAMASSGGPPLAESPKAD